MKAELCIDNYEAAKLAQELGYDSVEVNSALTLGGMTPPIGMVRKIANNLDIESMVMIRNRPAGFCYTDIEYEAMKEELEILLRENITGIVFGFLTEGLEIDRERTKYFVDKAKAHGKLTMFHRAFDNTKDPYQAIETLIDLGVDRVLTSGQSPKVEGGLELLKELQTLYGHKIQIVAGSGVTPANVYEIVKKTGLRYVHSSNSYYATDLTTTGKVDYRISTNLINEYQSVCEGKAKKFIKRVKNL